MSRRNATPEVFGASLLDMMTCGFGAVLLLFIIQRGVNDGNIETIREQVAVNQAVISSIADHTAPPTVRAQSARRSSAGPPSMGVPIESGVVVYLLDMSESMTDYGPVKRDTAIRIIHASIASPRGPSRVAVVGFARQPRLLIGWQEIGDNREAQATQIRESIAQAFDPGPDTDLAGALVFGINLLNDLATDGTIILLSDGLHFIGGVDGSPDQTLSGEAIVERTVRHARSLGFPDGVPTIHAVGILDWPSRTLDLARPDDLASFQSTLRKRRQSAGPSQSGITSARLDITQLLSASSAELTDPFGTFAFQIERWINPPLDFELGDSLYRLANRFGGRFIAITIDPFPLVAPAGDRP